MHMRVVHDYVAQYSDPIMGRAGARLVVLRGDDEYPGWWWCRGPDDREGWVPEAFLRRDGPAATLLRDYDAHELGVRAGQDVQVHETASAWARVTDRAGREGWIPTHCLTPG
jgi:SH3-like domain-containing protein